MELDLPDQVAPGLGLLSSAPSVRLPPTVNPIIVGIFFYFLDLVTPGELVVTALLPRKVCRPGP
jgi:hypothetical protein